MRVLSVVHEPGSTGGGGLFEDLVEERGDRLERVMIADDASALDAPARYDAIMVFGGAMHPDQDAEHPWLADEASFLREAVDREVPLFGVCLGAQLIARSVGAHIGPARAPEVGWREVHVNDAGRADPVVGVLPERLDAFQWHYYGFELPTGAELLAENEAALQAFRLGERTWGVQFHPEVTRAHARSLVHRGRGRAVRRRGCAEADERAPPDLERPRPAALRSVPRRRRRLSRPYCSIGSSSFDDHSCQEPG